MGGDALDRRRTPRIRARFDTLVSAEGREGGGVLADISRSGARLDDCSEQPPVGTRVRLYLFVESAGPFALEGPVVRHTETGFAIAFEIFDVATRRVVEAVIARAAMPATG